jgi:hypothetical protein
MQRAALNGVSAIVTWEFGVEVIGYTVNSEPARTGRTR